MKQTALFFITCWLTLLLSSCTNHIKQGDEYFRQASEAIAHDSIIRAYSLIEKAINEYQQGEDLARENKARIFLSLLYFSTDQKDKAYETIKEIKRNTLKEEDYPLYSNYFRIKAYYLSVYDKNTKEAVALMDSVLAYDHIYAKENQGLLNLDRLNKCEILLNGSKTAQVRQLIDSVLATTPLPSPLEPQIYANTARWFEAVGEPDSAYRYAKLVVDKTSKIHEDIDNNIYALDIILRYAGKHDNLSEYIQYRDLFERLKDERLGERVKYGMAFVKEQNITETLRLKAQTERNTLIWIAVSILLVALMVLLFLWHKHKDALTRNEMTQLECDRLDAEAFRRKLENELLLRKINSTSDELLKANNEILELSQQLAQKKDLASEADASYLQKLLDAVACNYPSFQQRMADQYPGITKTEATLASLIKLNLSSEEITTAMSISKSGLIKARYRLRKRLGVESSSELDNFIAKI